MTCRPNDVTGVCNCVNCRIPDDECACGRQLDGDGLCEVCDEDKIEMDTVNPDLSDEEWDRIMGAGKIAPAN